jgi:hypothetical protein
MGKSHFSGPLIVGGKQLTENPTIELLELTASAEYDDEEIQDIADKIDEVIEALIAAGVIQEGAGG